MAIKKYSDFRGRSRRREFWWFSLFCVLGSVVTASIDQGLGTTPLINLLFIIAIFLPGIAVSVRRLHDTNRTGWWTLVPIANIVFWVQDSGPSANRFGQNPKSEAEIQVVAPAKSSVNVSNLDQIEKLAALRDKGILTDAEFQAKKASLL